LSILTGCSFANKIINEIYYVKITILEKRKWWN